MTETIVARNRRARHDYEILETLEAGLVLRGTEVKSVREGNVNLSEGYATVERGEAYLCNVHIRPYGPASQWNADPLRKRKLLLHRREIEMLANRIDEKGLTIVPLDIHFRAGFAKATLAVARGKKKYDKREAVKRREMQREADRELGRRG